jgi:hypothetical protein
MPGLAPKLIEEKRHLEAVVCGWAVAFFFICAGTYLVVTSPASRNGGPEAMFDGWILLPAAIGAILSLVAAVFLLAALCDLLCYRLRLRSIRLKKIARQSRPQRQQL